MILRIVKTQSELDSAIKGGTKWIEIRSEPGVCLEVRSCGAAKIKAYDYSSVRVYDSTTIIAHNHANVWAFDTSTVKAHGSATVHAHDNARVVAGRSSTVEANDTSSVLAYGSATVTACDKTSVMAYNVAMVTACDNAVVKAYDSAIVAAYDNSTVAAFGSVTVKACGNSRIKASRRVAIYVHSENARTTGGVVLDHSDIDRFDAERWCEYHGVEVINGIAKVYKAVKSDWTADCGLDYSPGALPSVLGGKEKKATTVTAAKEIDGKDQNRSPKPMYFGPSPFLALNYYADATRFVAVGVKIEDLTPVSGGIARCETFKVSTPCVEVDIDGNVIQGQTPPDVSLLSNIG